MAKSIGMPKQYISTQNIILWDRVQIVVDIYLSIDINMQCMPTRSECILHATVRSVDFWCFLSILLLLLILQLQNINFVYENNIDILENNIDNTVTHASRHKSI